MAFLPPFLAKLFQGRRASTIDRYQVRVITSPAELAASDDLPIEIRYVMAVRPSRFETLRQFLENGYGIGGRIMEKTPERVLQAVDRISRETQENTVIPWLNELLRAEEIPIFTKEELERAEKRGVNLYEETKVILSQRYEFVKIVLVDLQNRGVTEAERKIMAEINEDLYPLAIDMIVHQVTADNAHTRTEVAQTIIKALIIIGPLAHFLEHAISGLGKLFAASADDLLSETAELFALRGSGFTWRQLASRSRLLIVVFALATYGAFQVQPLIDAGHPALAGIVFGWSAVALSLTTTIQSVGLYKQSYRHLLRDGKLRLASGQSIMRFALRQDFTNPTRLGLLIGACTSPILSAIIFVSFPGIISNGWVLAALGSTESILAGLTVIGAGPIGRWLFHLNVRRALANTVTNPSPRHTA